MQEAAQGHICFYLAHLNLKSVSLFRSAKSQGIFVFL